MFWIRDPYPFPSLLSESLMQKNTAQALTKLWPILSKQRGLPGPKETHYALQPELAEAYTAYYLPANALKIYFVLEEMRRLGLPLPEKKITIADLGSGPGSALCGAALWGKENSREINYHAWEQSKFFIGQGENLSTNLRKNFSITTSWSLAKREPLDFLKHCDPDVVLFQNSVHEIFSDPKERQRELEKIISLLKRSGGAKYLILIEPALRDSSRELLELRSSLIASDKARIWLPCLDNRPCGALSTKNDWCHEEVPVKFPEWMNNLGASAQMHKDSLLFSYLVISSPALEVSHWQSGALRMVSQRLEHKGQTECLLCTQSGKVKARVQRSKVTEENAQLQSWIRGDLFSQVELGESNDLVRATRLGAS